MQSLNSQFRGGKTERGSTFLVQAALLMMILGTASCATYYQEHLNFNTEFEKGNLRNALQTLEQSRKEAEGKNRFIYHANDGLLHSILGEYEKSNESLEKAFLFGEDFRLNYLNEAITYLSNPNFAVYRGEDHEHLMVLYFKAINYLKMNRPEEALVECRRLTIRLNQLSDRYRSEDKLQRDAFIHTLMGIIYQSSQDYNNAFIAYRNALDVYENEYAKLFQMEVPLQLKKDLLNTAYLTGFQEEFELYRAKFAMNDYTPVKPEAELVFFWHNGLAPVKDEWGINFVIDHNRDNLVVFNNEMLGMSFPFNLDKDEKDKKRDLASLEVFRVAFPRYQERPLYYTQAVIKTEAGDYPLELGEDISKIAFKNLQQRMLQEFSKGLLRAAMKKATEHSLRKENKQLGSVLGMVNAFTEKADTRSWQTLPHSIYYARVPLKEGSNEIAFQVGEEEQEPFQFNYKASRGQTLFHTFSSFEAKPVQYRYY